MKNGEQQFIEPELVSYSHDDQYRVVVNGIETTEPANRERAAQIVTAWKRHQEFPVNIEVHTRRTWTVFAAEAWTIANPDPSEWPE